MKLVGKREIMRKIEMEIQGVQVATYQSFDN